MTTILTLVPINFNIAFSIGYVIGIAFTLIRFQAGEILGSPGMSWKRIGLTIISVVSLILWAPGYVSGGLAVGYVAGAVWVGLMIHEAL